MAKIELPHNYEPRGYQLNAWRHMERPIEGLRAAAEWHRRAGKDLFGINLTAVKSQERVGTYWHVLPTYKQGKNIVWNGFTKEGRKFLDYLPTELIEKKNETELKITFKNGSIYQVVGTDNINSLVGTNPIGVIMSEYSLHDPAAWDYLRPILAENGGWAIFIYTLRGKNHGFKLGQLAKGLMQKGNDKWFYEKLVAGDAGTKRPDGTPVISDAMIQAERESGMPEELILQEFYCSADAPLVGAYYSVQMQWLEKQVNKTGLVDAQGIPVSERFGSHIQWNPRLDVDTWWDLGYDDSTTIWFVQHLGDEVRLVDYYENSGESLAHYIKYCKSLPYVYGTNFAPHDISVHEYSTGITRIQAAKDLGWKFRPVPKHMVEDGIESVRNMLPRCWFSDKTERGIAALREYCKEWDEDKKVFRSSPLHNWASHGADAFRTGAWGTKQNRPKKKRKTRQQDDYDYLRGRPKE